MVDVVTLRTCGSHDGRVGNGGAVVAANGTCHTSGNRNDGDRFACRENAENYRNENTECTPRCAGREGESDCDSEDYSGKEVFKCACRFLDKLRNEYLCAEGVRHSFKCPCAGKNHYSRNHGFEALWKSVHYVGEGHCASNKEVNDRYYKRNECTERKTYGSVGVRECVDKALAGEESAGIYHSDNAADYENNNGQNKVDNLTLGVDFRIACVLMLAGGEDIVVVDSVKLMLCHRTVVEVCKGKEEHHKYCKKRVEVVGDSAYEKAYAVFRTCAARKARNGSRPRRNGSYYADGGCGSVNEVRELGS